MPGHPYGINPTESLLDKSVDKAREILSEPPETTCSHCTNCCRAGMPNLYYVEFVNLRRNHIEKLSPKERIDLTIECVRRYLWNVDHKRPKPCAFLGEDSMCKVYDSRPLKCRLYGVIPDSTYARNAEAVAKDMGVLRAEMPLANQCPFVKIKPQFGSKFPNNNVSEDDIKKWEALLRGIDRQLGMPPQVQDDGFGFLTYHDWHLLFEMGPEWMASLTKLRTLWNDEQKEKFLGDLKRAFEAKD